MRLDVARLYDSRDVVQPGIIAGSCRPLIFLFISNRALFYFSILFKIPSNIPEFSPINIFLSTVSISFSFRFVLLKKESLIVLSALACMCLILGEISAPFVNIIK